MRMDLRTYMSEHHGGQLALAKRLGIPASQVNNWCQNVRPVPAIWCSMIEAWSGGRVSRAELRPNDHYMLWPEL